MTTQYNITKRKKFWACTVPILVCYPNTVVIINLQHLQILRRVLLPRTCLVPPDIEARHREHNIVKVPFGMRSVVLSEPNFARYSFHFSTNRPCFYKQTLRSLWWEPPARSHPWLPTLLNSLSLNNGATSVSTSVLSHLCRSSS